MLGVCWSPSPDDAASRTRDLQRMCAAGLEYVRVGRASWGRIEPKRGAHALDALDVAVDDAVRHGLRVVVALPTGLPPRWLTSAHPEVHLVDETGTAVAAEDAHPCVLPAAYRERALALIETLVNRFASRVDAFELDPRLGAPPLCHCDACASAFRAWLTARHEQIEALNSAWLGPLGERPFDSFEQITPPLRGHSASPAHRLDYRRFSRECLGRFVDAVREIVHRVAPEGLLVSADAEAFGTPESGRGAAQVDIAGGASLPLPWTEAMAADVDPRCGHPDVAALHHDLRRGLGQERFRVTDQQCGPLIGKTRIAVPRAGMIRLWTWEAFAHGAEMVMHTGWQPDGLRAPSGLLRADGEEDAGHAEASRVARELAFVEMGATRPAPVALVVDEEAADVYALVRPGRGTGYGALVLTFYEALRRLGLDIDVVRADRVPPHRLVAVPSLPVWPWAHSGFLHPGQQMVLGPRTASRTPFLYTDTRGLGDGRNRLRAIREESGVLDPATPMTWQGRTWPTAGWREWIDSDAIPVARFDDGDGAVFEAEGLHRLAFSPSVDFLIEYLETICSRVGIDTLRLSSTLRLRRRGDLTFAFNHSPEVVPVPAPDDAAFLLGSRDVAGYSVTGWRSGSPNG
ncbi:MAG: hypothetical protein EB084_03400 [Proteobacteria bacterium]|nr:hypothetical protein [Pseudomonadota bacterium]